MSLFDKLFKKNEQPQQAPTEEHNKDILETPYGEFEYDPSPDCAEPEFGYGGDVDWYNEDEYEYGSHYYPVGVYLECNTPDTRDADKSYEIFLRIMNFKERTDAKLKTAVADYYDDGSGLIVRDHGDPISREELIENLEVTYLHVYGNGDAVFYLNHHCRLSLDNVKKRIRAKLKADGSVEVVPK